MYSELYVCVLCLSVFVTCAALSALLLFAKAWPEDALEMVAQQFLEDVEMQEAERSSVVVICKHFHESTRHASEK